MTDISNRPLLELHRPPQWVTALREARYQATSNMLQVMEDLIIRSAAYEWSDQPLPFEQVVRLLEEHIAYNRAVVASLYPKD